MTGKVLMTCDLARRYGLKDIDGTEDSVKKNSVCFHAVFDPFIVFPGRSVADYTSLKFVVSQLPYVSWLSIITPSFIRVPRFMLSLASGKF